MLTVIILEYACDIAPGMNGEPQKCHGKNVFFRVFRVFRGQ